MKLKDFIAYLERRFPPQAEILYIQISMISDNDLGLVETITMFEDGDDGPDDSETMPEPRNQRSPHLRAIS